MSHADEEMFLNEWLHEDPFHGWLVKVTNDESKAYCRFCCIVLRAAKIELLAHLRTQIHVTNAKVAQESGVNNGPISVQIVCNEDEVPVNDEDFPEHVGEEVVNGDIEYKPVVTATRSPSKRTPSGKNYIKKYRTAWEEEEEFRDWLQAYPEDVQRAFCKSCKAILRAHKHDLTCHARTTRHQKKMQEYKAEQGGEQLFQMIAEDVVTLPQSKHRLDESGHSSVSEIGIEIDGSGIFPDTNCSREESKTKIVKMSKPKLSVTPKPICRKRVRINAADVVAAIENNEFTGYELLQIVKKAVPKL